MQLSTIDKYKFIFYPVLIQIIFIMSFFIGLDYFTSDIGDGLHDDTFLFIKAFIIITTIPVFFSTLIGFKIISGKNQKNIFAFSIISCILLSVVISLTSVFIYMSLPENSISSGENIGLLVPIIGIPILIAIILNIIATSTISNLIYKKVNIQ